eukprot:TRINITY_DN4779_c0_g2_i2.p1 TRINITY_DN4779_c0_g2~~TRINITY_DN4779_c0_g2_i2.p1  ORF type:complete len:386 (-),score=118.36 TRINITY_DN4779_c0_g2_i2:42-1199(-)
MSTNRGIWGKTKSKLYQTKQNAMAKFGQSDETVDVKFNFEVERFDKNYANVKAVRENALKMNQALKEFAVAQNAFYESLAEVFKSDDGNTTNEAALSVRAGVSEIDNARVQFEQSIDAGVIKPIDRYRAQFKEMKKRMGVWKSRKTDMDRYKHEVKLNQAKGRKDERSVYVAEKATRASDIFSIINKEIQYDLSKLWEDRIPFFEPVFATSTSAATEFYCLATGSMSQAAGLLGRIDKSRAVRHPFVITPVEDSAAHKSSSKSLAPQQFLGNSSIDINQAELMVNQEEAPSPLLNSPMIESSDTVLSPALVGNVKGDGKETVKNPERPELIESTKVKSIGSMTEVSLDSPAEKRELNKGTSLREMWSFKEDNDVFRVQPEAMPSG